MTMTMVILLGVLMIAAVSAAPGTALQHTQDKIGTKKGKRGGSKGARYLDTRTVIHRYVCVPEWMRGTLGRVKNEPGN